MNPVPFCQADVLAATLSTTRVSAGPPVAPAGPAPACTSSLALRGASARSRGRGRVTVEVLRVSRGRRVTRATRIARLRGATVTWSGRSARRDGTYVVRVRLGGEVRRIAVVRRRGRFYRLVNPPVGGRPVPRSERPLA